MDDRRAHERIGHLEEVVGKHLIDHARFEESLLRNTELTMKIAENTSELVTLVRGAKGLRTFMVWVTPVVIGVAAVITWFDWRE